MSVYGIKALCPGGDWVAVFLHNEEPWVSFDRVAVFAAGEHEGDIIEGFINQGGHLDSASEVMNFHCYAHRADITYEMKAGWIAEAKKKARM